jgi:hypothetical protein
MPLPHYTQSRASSQRYEPVQPNLFEVTIFSPLGDGSFASMPGQTFVDLTLNFSLNLNEANENYIYNTFRNWTNIIYDPLTGEMGLKKDYVGSMIVVQYNRAGDIFRKITFKDVFPTGQMDFIDELNYTTPDAAQLSMTYRCDHWVEENVGS